MPVRPKMPYSPVYFASPFFPVVVVVAGHLVESTFWAKRRHRDWQPEPRVRSAGPKALLLHTVTDSLLSAAQVDKNQQIQIDRRYSSPTIRDRAPTSTRPWTRKTWGTEIFFCTYGRDIRDREHGENGMG